MKLTFWEFVCDLFGFGYVVNHRSKEIHRLANKQDNCRLHLISKGEYVSRRKAVRLIRKHNYNGCRWCWKGEDRG